MRAIEFPDDWTTADVLDLKAFDDGGVLVFLIFLADGTIGASVGYEGGAHHLRAFGGPVDHRVEEREEGAPTDEEREAVESALARLRERIDVASRAAAADLGMGMN